MNKQEELLKAIECSENEAYVEAIEICTNILKHYPEFDRAYFERAMAYLEMNQDHLALADFETLNRINPHFPGGRDWYAKTLSGLKDFRKSADLQYAELQSNPNGKYHMGANPQAWAECADAFYKAGDRPKAEEVLKEYFKNYSDKVSTYAIYETAPHRFLTKLYLDTERYELALVEATKAIQSEYKKPKDQEWYIQALIENNRLEEAEKVLKDFVDTIYAGSDTPQTKALKERIENRI